MKTIKNIKIKQNKVYNMKGNSIVSDFYEDIAPDPSYDIQVTDIDTKTTWNESSDDFFTFNVESAEGIVYKVIIDPSLFGDHTRGIIMNQRSNQLTIKTVNQDLQNFKIYVKGEFDKVNKKIDTKIAEVNTKIDTKIAEVNTKIAEVNTKIDDVKKELNAKMDKGFEEIKTLILAKNN